jgi:hypothetical protein
VVSVVKEGSYTASETANKQGNGRFCVEIAAAPAGAVTVTLTLTVKVTAGSKAYKPSSFSFSIVKQLAIRATLQYSHVAPNGAQVIHVTTGPGASLTYQVSYGHGAVVLARHTASKGSDSLRFVAKDTPFLPDGSDVAVITISGVAQKVVKGQAALHFTVQRHASVADLKALQVRVVTATVKPGAKIQIQIVAARGAKVSCSVSYGPKQPKAKYTATANGSGSAVLTFPAPAKLPKHTSLRATVTLTAAQGKRTAHAATAFTIKA